MRRHSRTAVGVALLGQFAGFAPLAAAQQPADERPAFESVAQPPAVGIDRKAEEQTPGATRASLPVGSGVQLEFSASSGSPPDVGTDVVEWDPVEGLNRGFFAFNDVLDVYAIEPAARGWKAVTPQGVRNSVTRFFTNLQFPLRFVGCLTQGKVVAGGSEVVRFVLNTTVGVAGFFDPATPVGFPLHDEDLGQSFGVWGIGAGPYLVLPFLGPTTGRDFLDIPLGSTASLVPGLNLVNLVNTRAGLLVEIREAKDASLDYYAFIRSAYLQRREALILDRNPQDSAPQETNDDIYNLSDE
jgi:phospholipid-binding lipoprotein MlaA